MPPRARSLPDSPPTFPTLPRWARLAATSEETEETAFVAGAVLAALNPIAVSEHPLGQLWRQRLALGGAEAIVRLQGRNEDGAELRDHWYLTRKGDDPGPAGRVLGAWRALGDRRFAASNDRLDRLADLLQVPLEPDLRDRIALILSARLAPTSGGGAALPAVAALTAMILQAQPDARPLALWLADALLARHLQWPVPVPLLAAHLRRADLRHVRDPASQALWLRACALAYARAGAAASDLYADLARRADRLIAVAPKLRGRDADSVVARLLREDAQAAKPGEAASDRSGRRLFERLVEFGAVRELTGRPTFRLYGL